MRRRNESAEHKGTDLGTLGYLSAPATLGADLIGPPAGILACGWAGSRGVMG